MSLEMNSERCYRFATVSPGKSGQTVAVEAGIHARQVAVSGQVARNPCPQGLGSGSGESWFEPRRGNFEGPPGDRRRPFFVARRALCRASTVLRSAPDCYMMFII